MTFIREAMRNSRIEGSKEYNLHVKHNPHESADGVQARSFELFKRQCVDHLPKRLVRNIKLNVYRWIEVGGRDQFHNRFVFTELGAVKFGTGLDKGREGTSDQLNLLSQDVLKNDLWKKILGTKVGGTFGLLDWDAYQRALKDESNSSLPEYELNGPVFTVVGTGG